MKTLAVALIALLLGACASAPPPMPPAAPLFHDELFEAPTVRIDADAALALSPAMRHYLSTRLVPRPMLGDRRRELVNALYRGELKLEYDAEITRTAAEAFDARSGNCLALVLMTAAFAKELHLTVHYQSVVGEEAWDRAGELYIGIGHVNLVLEDNTPQGSMRFAQRPLVIDFLPLRNAERLETREIDERTLIAMYLNNRAVESLARGQTSNAYWWVREALRTDPSLLSAYVSLGVVYRARHQPALAEAALRRVAQREPDNVYALSNRIVALREGRYEAARRLFAKEVARAPYHHEFEYWLAVSYLQLNDAERASVHLKRAMEVSTTRKDHDLYAAKLDRLKALSAQ